MDREPMTKDKERDALIAEKKRLAYFLECKEGTLEAEAMFRRAAALLRGDEPAKPDRWTLATREVLVAYVDGGAIYTAGVTNGEHDNLPKFQAAAAVLRRHFEPPSVVVEAAEMVQRLSEGATAGTYYASAKAIADFILKGDQ